LGHFEKFNRLGNESRPHNYFTYTVGNNPKHIVCNSIIDRKGNQKKYVFFFQLMDGSSEDEGRLEEESGHEEPGGEGLLLLRTSSATSGGNRRRNKTAGAGGGGSGGGSLQAASTSESRILCRICGDSAVRCDFDSVNVIKFLYLPYFFIWAIFHIPGMGPRAVSIMML
jgi:hypothetical protein